MKSKKINKRKYVKKNTIKKVNKKTKTGKFSKKYNKKQIKTKRFRRKRTTRTMGNISRNIRGTGSNNRAVKMMSQRKWKGGVLPQNSEGKIVAIEADRNIFNTINSDPTIEYVRSIKDSRITVWATKLKPIIKAAREVEDRKNVWEIAFEETEKVLHIETLANKTLADKQATPDELEEAKQRSIFFQTRNDGQNRHELFRVKLATVPDIVARQVVLQGWGGVTIRNMWDPNNSGQGVTAYEILNTVINDRIPNHIMADGDSKYMDWSDKGINIAKSRIKQYPYAIQAASVIVQVLVWNNLVKNSMNNHAINAVTKTFYNGLIIDREDKNAANDEEKKTKINSYEKHIYKVGLIYAAQEAADLIIPDQFLSTDIDIKFLDKAVEKAVEKQVEDTVNDTNDELINVVATLNLNILIWDVVAKFVTIKMGDAIIQNNLVKSVRDNIKVPSFVGNSVRWVKLFIVHILESSEIISEEDKIRFMKLLCEKDEVELIMRKETSQENEIAEIDIKLKNLKEKRATKYSNKKSEIKKGINIDSETVIKNAIEKVLPLVQNVESDAEKKLPTLLDSDPNNIVGNKIINDLNEYATNAVNSVTV